MRIPTTGMECDGYHYSFKVVHRGQPRPYADHLLIVDIFTWCPDENMVLRAIQNDVPRKGIEYETACRLLGPGAYFAGCYEIEKFPGGWRYTKHEPFTD